MTKSNHKKKSIKKQHKRNQKRKTTLSRKQDVTKEDLIEAEQCPAVTQRPDNGLWQKSHPTIQTEKSSSPNHFKNAAPASSLEPPLHVASASETLKKRANCFYSSTDNEDSGNEDDCEQVFESLPESKHNGIRFNSSQDGSDFLNSFEQGPEDSLLSNFAGLSPCNNLFEEDEMINNSFDDPFNVDFLDDNDFETFSFNDMENIFDHNENSNDACHYYSTSETEVSEDDFNKPYLRSSVTNCLDFRFKSHQNIGDELGSRFKRLFPNDHSQRFYSGCSDEEDQNQLTDDNSSFESDHSRVLRHSRLLDSFPQSPKRIFAPNKFVKPSKSVLKLNKSNSVTFIVSTNNGSVRDATKYATQMNSENCDGIEFPSAEQDEILIPAHQSKRSRKKQQKGAIIQAQKLEKLLTSQADKISNQTNVENITDTSALRQNELQRKVGFYSESALTNYLQDKNHSLFFRRNNFKNNDLGTHKQLRKYSSSIQLNDRKNKQISRKFSKFNNESTSSFLSSSSRYYSDDSENEYEDMFGPFSFGRPMFAPLLSLGHLKQPKQDKPQKKSVKWAQKLEW